MRTLLLSALLSLIMALSVSSATRSSANYSVPADTVDNGGGRSASAAYTHDGSAGGIGGVATVAAPPQFAKQGYIGQLYEVTGLALSVSSTNVDEGATRQLEANALLDDGTLLSMAISGVSWSILNGPIGSINSVGLATAGNVYQDTPAAVQGSLLSSVGMLGLLVVNSDNDDFEKYAKDGLDDSWQVQNFGLNNPDAGPDADPDGDTQNNLYEFIVGSIPVDGSSFFRFRIELVPGQPSHRNLIFSPRVAGRTYAVQYKLGAGVPGFDNLAGIATTDIGPTRTVTDLNATETNKFYRMSITLP